MKKVKIGAGLLVLFSIGAGLHFFYWQEPVQCGFARQKKFRDLPDEAALAWVKDLFRRAQLSPPFPAMPPIPGIERDEEPRHAFISFSDGENPASVVWADGQGLPSAAAAACEKFRAAIKAPGSLRWLKVDFVSEIFLMPLQNWTLPEFFDASLHGLAFRNGPPLAFLPEELQSAGIIGLNRELRLEKLLLAMRRKSPPGEPPAVETAAPAAEALSLTGFSTQSYFTDGREAARLFRGHRAFPQLSKSTLLESAKQAGHYLVRHLDVEGRFAYSFDPTAQTISSDYNLLRHAGAVLSLLDLYGETRAAELLAAAERAIAHALKFTAPSPANPEALCVVENNEVKLGGNAILILALCKYGEVAQDPRHLETSKRLGQFLKDSQKDNGDFIHKYSFKPFAPADFVSSYYPGQAVWAFARLHGATRDEAWLDAAEKAAGNLIQVRDQHPSIDEPAPDHWLLLGLNDLFRQRRQLKYLQHAHQIALAMARQQISDPHLPAEMADWLGGYYRPPTSVSTAIRSEGLAAAFALEGDFLRPAETTPLFQALQRGIQFQLQTQYRPENAMYFANPQNLLGGFRYSLTDPHIRIDYVQHGISSLLAAARFLP